MMVEVVFALMLLSVAFCSWGVFFVAMTERMGKAQERALGYLSARSCMGRFMVEGITTLTENGFEITVRPYKQLGRFSRVALEVKGKSESFTIYTGICR